MFKTILVVCIVQRSFIDLIPCRPYDEAWLVRGMLNQLHWLTAAECDEMIMFITTLQQKR
jgi:hypothetical protein